MRGVRVAGRGWAYFGALLGGVASIAANVAHSYVPPASAPAGWAPPVGAVVASVFWPVALFVAIEILARTVWRPGRRWVVLRFGGLIPVAAVAAVVSYRHLSGLLGYYGEDPLTVVIGPLAVDGLMVMATGALIATGRTRHTPEAAAGTGPAPAPAPPVTDVPVPVGPTVPAAPVRLARPRTGGRTSARTGASNTRRTGTRAARTGARTDADLLNALANVPRDSDGTVPVRRAAAALGTGPDRARRLLGAAGLLRTPGTTPGAPTDTTVPDTTIPDAAVPDATPVRTPAAAQSPVPVPAAA